MAEDAGIRLANFLSLWGGAENYSPSKVPRSPAPQSSCPSDATKAHAPMASAWPLRSQPPSVWMFMALWFKP